ncbi:MAG: ppiB [Bacteroidetes bacterium]|jgi:FKBP-type peptidyl-prolyl cis-trans isomerase|nr:ppiB [Bacteroidota bacterium]
MKQLFVLISAVTVMNFGAMGQKSMKQKLSKEDTEFLAAQPEGMYAKLETSRGTIYTTLDFKQFPMTVANFSGLAEGTIANKIKPAGTPYYDDMKFHRVIPDFMIQGGCPLGNGGGDPGYSFEDEMDPNSEQAKKGYVRGTLAMANRGPNTNGSQFFIMHKDKPLPYNYAIFGHVVKGIEVVDSIAATPRGNNDLPLQDQKILHLLILKKGKEAEAFDAPKVFETEKANAGVKAAERAKAEQEKQKIAMEAANKEVNEKYGTAKTTASGLRYIIEKEGEGSSPAATSTVTIHYTGTFLNGTKFDSSVDKGQPATFPLQRLIPGWIEGLQLIKPGGKIKLIIPPNLGWGAQGAGAIPPNSWTVFDIELFSFK